MLSKAASKAVFLKQKSSFCFRIKFKILTILHRELYYLNLLFNSCIISLISLSFLTIHMLPTIPRKDLVSLCFCELTVAISSASNVISNFSIKWTSTDTSGHKGHLHCEVFLLLSFIPNHSTVTHFLTSAPMVLCPYLTTYIV